MRKIRKKSAKINNNYKLLVSVFVAFMICLLLPMGVRADGIRLFTCVGSASDGGNNIDVTNAIILDWNGTTYLIGDLSDGEYYLYQTEDTDTAEMTKCDNPWGIDDGMNWFNPVDPTPLTIASVAQGALGEEFELYYENSDDELNHVGVVIDQYEAYENLYLAPISADVDGEYPMALTYGNGIIGYVPQEGVAVLFEEPTGGTSSQETEPATEAETEPETEAETEPETEIETKQEQETTPETEAATTVESESETNQDKSEGNTVSDFLKNYPWAIAVVVVLIIIIIIILLKKKNNNDTHGPGSTSGSVIPPVSPEPKVEPLNSTVSTPQPVPVVQPHVVQSPYWCINANGFEYQVRNEMTAGRNPDCDVRFPETTKGVSRRHCKFFINNNRLYVMDLGSSYGTYLGVNTKLAPNVPQKLNVGDVVYLGGRQNAITVRYQ